MNRAAIAVALVVSWVQFGWGFCPDGSVDWKGNCAAMPRSLDASKEELAKWTSTETAPKHPQPEWETGAVHADNLQPVNPADEHHPKDCPNNCKWDGGTCTCGDKAAALTVSDAGKKP